MPSVGRRRSRWTIGVTAIGALTASLVYTQLPTSGEPENVAPEMSALADVDGVVDEAFAIECSCTDDGLPASPGAISYTWTQTAGSGTCAFGDDNDPTTTATCDEADDYTIECECSDGELTDTDTLTASVTEPLYFDGLSSGAQTEINSLYSTKHKLRAAYSGNAYLARRHDTDATQAIGFTAGNLVDTSALATFCSGSTCSIQTFYDQSAAGRDLTQATEANQPQVYASGAVIINGTSNSPAYSCDGTDYLTRSDSSGFSGNEALAFAFNWARVSGTSDLGIFQVGNSTSGQAFILFTFNPGDRWGASIISGNQRYVPNPVNTTWAYHIVQKANAAQVGQSTWETNGATLTLGTNTNPTNTTNMGTTQTALCALFAGTNGQVAYGSTFITSQALLAGADLTWTRSFLALDN